jgi:hypothetical protein
MRGSAGADFSASDPTIPRRSINFGALANIESGVEAAPARAEPPLTPRGLCAAGQTPPARRRDDGRTIRGPGASPGWLRGPVRRSWLIFPEQTMSKFLSTFAASADRRLFQPLREAAL